MSHAIFTTKRLSQSTLKSLPPCGSKFLWALIKTGYRGKYIYSVAVCTRNNWGKQAVTGHQLNDVDRLTVVSLLLRAVANPEEIHNSLFRVGFDPSRALKALNESDDFAQDPAFNKWLRGQGYNAIETA